MSDDLQIMHRTMERERLARKKAESLLEMREAELLDRHHELTTVVSIMRSQLEMFEEAVNALTFAIVTLEVDGTIRLFNRHAQRLFGLVPEEVLGTSFRSLMPQIFSRENARRLRDDLLLGQVTNISQANGRRKDGTPFSVDVKCNMTVKKDRRRLTLVITPPDRNEKRKETEEVVAGKPMEREADKPELDPPATNPVELLKFLASYEQLRAQKNNEASADQLIQRIDSMVSALIDSTFEGGIPEELVAHALPALHAPEGSGFPTAVGAEVAAPLPEKPRRKKKRVVARAQCSHQVVRKQADINKLLETAIDQARVRWSDSAELTTDLHPELPPLRGDRNALVRVFQDLLAYCTAGIEEAIANKENEYEKGQIEVATCFDEEKIEVRIRDNGVGLMSVFHSRVPSMNDGDQEIEIQQGIADCQAIVNDKYHGEFAVRTAPNDGTTFEVWIPLKS